MNYCIIDESDPQDEFECEGAVFKTFFKSSKLFTENNNLELIRKNISIESQLKKLKNKHFNIFQLSAHGHYEKRAKSQLHHSYVYKKRGHQEIEIFRPDSIVRTGLQADLFISTNCSTFNPQFIDIVKHYDGISNFIAPVNKPYIGNTLIFSLMFYNKLLQEIYPGSHHIADSAIIEAFLVTRKAYKKYNGDEEYRLYNRNFNKTFC